MDKCIEINNVSYSYGERQVLEDISLSLRRGTIHGLLGPNGAGKTTSFYMVMGLVKPDEGCVRFKDYEITHAPMYQRARIGMGYLAQEPSIFRKLNVEDNIKLVLEVNEKLSKTKSSP